MAELATKQQSQKIFEKLKAKPANKVSYATSIHGPPTFLTKVDLLRLQPEEPDLDICSSWHLPLPRLLCESP